MGEIEQKGKIYYKLLHLHMTLETFLSALHYINVASDLGEGGSKDMLTPFENHLYPLLTARVFLVLEKKKLLMQFIDLPSSKSDFTLNLQ